MSEVKVTQADREAAAEYHRLLKSSPIAVAFILSEHSDGDSLVQAFARHRQSATTEALAAMEQAQEALEGALSVMDAEGLCVCRAVKREMAEALATLTEQIERMRG